MAKKVESPTANDDRDGELLSQIVERDRTALEALYGRYGNTVYSVAVNMLRDAGAAEEVTQDVFFNVWRRAASYNSQRGSVTAWLLRIAHNRTLDELRKRKRVQYGWHLSLNEQVPSDARGNDPVEYAVAQIEGGCLKDALFCLKPEQREVVVLAYFNGMTHSEIAEELRQPIGTVKSRMRAAMIKLREVLGPQLHSDEPDQT